ncbi:MAG: NRDE family protein [Bacillota bacterium]
MCLIIFAYDCHPEYSLILAANRDEFYDRPAETARFWTEQPQILAGKDLEQSGTWLGVTAHGRFAAITNYRDPGSVNKDSAQSRGLIVKDYLCSKEKPPSFLAALDKARDKYNGFNVLLMGGESLWYYSNRTGQAKKVSPGVHGLSNHLLDTPWPKVIKGIDVMGKIIERDSDAAAADLMKFLNDRQPAKDSELPDTGISREWEKLLSSPFISSPSYGTRSSTVLFVGRSGHIRFYERSYGSEGHPLGNDVFCEFKVAQQPRCSAC